MIKNSFTKKNFSKNFNLSKKKITNSIDFYSFLEELTLDLIDLVFKNTLKDFVSYDYALSGGKCINKIISQSKLNKSFNFDINILNGKLPKKHFSENFTRIINTSFKNKGKFYMFRYYLFNILKHNELVSDNEKSHYLTNILFYYGERESENNVLTEGIFIHFIFKQNLFIDGSFYSNINKISSINEILYPIANVNYDIDFGIEINESLIYVNNSIKYINIELVLYNLINYISHICFQNIMYKFSKNLKILGYFFNINNYNSSYLSNKKIIDKSFLYSYRKDLQDIYIIKLTQNNIFPDNFNKLNCKEIIESVIDTYNTDRESSINNRTLMLILPDSLKIISDNFIIIFGDKSKHNMISKINEIDLQYGRIIKNYTGTLYENINKNLIFASLKIIKNVDKQTNQMITAFNDVEKKSHIFKNKIKNDIFYVFRIQNFNCISNNLCSIFNLPLLKENDIIYFPTFLSTSYNRKYNYSSFVNEHSYLLRILLRKNGDNWILIDTYSSVSNEYEILLKNNLYYKVLSLNYTNIILNNNYFELPLITLIAYNDINSALNDHNIYDTSNYYNDYYKNPIYDPQTSGKLNLLNFDEIFSNNCEANFGQQQPPSLNKQNKTDISQDTPLLNQPQQLQPPSLKQQDKTYTHIPQQPPSLKQQLQQQQQSSKQQDKTYTYIPQQPPQQQQPPSSKQQLQQQPPSSKQQDKTYTYIPQQPPQQQQPPSSKQPKSKSKTKKQNGGDDSNINTIYNCFDIDIRASVDDDKYIFSNIIIYPNIISKTLKGDSEEEIENILIKEPIEEISLLYNNFVKLFSIFDGFEYDGMTEILLEDKDNSNTEKIYEETTNRKDIEVYNKYLKYKRKYIELKNLLNSKKIE